jgi:hypothetical protein
MSEKRYLQFHHHPIYLFLLVETKTDFYVLLLYLISTALRQMRGMIALATMFVC